MKYSEQIWVRLDPATKNWVKKQAAAEERSMNTWLRRLIEKAKQEAK